MKRWLKFLVSFGVLALLLVFVPWQQVREAWLEVSLSVWLAVLAGFLGVHFVGLLKWRMIVNANAGRECLHVRDACGFYGAGLFSNLCLPSIVGGDVLRAVLASNRTEEPEAVVLGGIADRMIDTAALAVLIIGGGFLAGVSSSEWGIYAAIILGVTGVGAAMIAFPLVIKRPLHRWPAKYRRSIARSLVALRRLRRNPGVMAGAFILALLMQTSFVLLNAWLGGSLGIEVPLAVWFLAWPLAKAAGLLPVSIGGLGVRDATLAALLVPFGVPAAHGLVTSLVWQTVLIGGGLIAGALWWLLNRSGEAGSAAVSLIRSPRESHG